MGISRFGHHSSSMKRFAFSLLLFGLFVSAAAARSTTVFIVRHAEKAETEHNNPDLTEAGRARAYALAQMLKDAGITTIYATQFNRTQQTAAPLAKLLGLRVTIVDWKDAAGLLNKLRHARGNSLVVAHRNTIPYLLEKMDVAGTRRMDETEYDNLFVVVLDKKKSRLIRLHYL
jgi:phosphohistidine phosphatase SixA